MISCLLLGLPLLLHLIIIIAKTKLKGKKKGIVINDASLFFSFLSLFALLLLYIHPIHLILMVALKKNIKFFFKKID